MRLKMVRNLLIIFVLASGLATFLYLQPWKQNQSPPPRLIDRLPDADVIGKSDVLEFSRSFSMTMFYYKIPFRDFLSPEFILSQGKNYGLDIQSPVYFFLNEGENTIENWGVVFSVRDSSKVKEGIAHLTNFVDIESTKFKQHKIFKYAENETYLTYGKDWLLLYGGHSLEPIVERVVNAKRNQISTEWRSFINETKLKEPNLIARIKSPVLNDYGITSGMVTVENDSSNLILSTNFHFQDSIPFTLKQGGPTYTGQEFTKHLVNIHFDKKPFSHNHPLYDQLKKLSAKIAFPLDEFLQTWEGDIAFRQGGIQKIRESYIESELDENFNVTEMTKYRTVKVPGFSLFLSMNEHKDKFVSRLLDKGILTKEERKYRLLFSPPLNMRQSDSSLIFHTSKYTPVHTIDSLNTGTWTIDYTPVTFYIDSIAPKIIFGRVNIPLTKIVSDNLSIQ